MQNIEHHKVPDRQVDTTEPVYILDKSPEDTNIWIYDGRSFSRLSEEGEPRFRVPCYNLNAEDEATRVEKRAMVFNQHYEEAIAIQNAAGREVHTIMFSDIYAAYSVPPSRYVDEELPNPFDIEVLMEQSKSLLTRSCVAQGDFNRKMKEIAAINIEDRTDDALQGIHYDVLDCNEGFGKALSALLEEELGKAPIQNSLTKMQKAYKKDDEAGTAFPMADYMYKDLDAGREYEAGKKKIMDRAKSEYCVIDVAYIYTTPLQLQALCQTAIEGCLKNLRDGLEYRECSRVTLLSLPELSCSQENYLVTLQITVPFVYRGMDV